MVCVYESICWGRPETTKNKRTVTSTNPPRLSNQQSASLHYSAPERYTPDCCNTLLQNIQNKHDLCRASFSYARQINNIPLKPRHSPSKRLILQPQNATPDPLQTNGLAPFAGVVISVHHSHLCPRCSWRASHRHSKYKKSYRDKKTRRRLLVA